MSGSPWTAPNFTVNPTNCDPFTVNSALTGGRRRRRRPLDVPFQVANCTDLPSTRSSASSSPARPSAPATPALTATLTQPKPGVRELQPRPGRRCRTPSSSTRNTSRRSARGSSSPPRTARRPRCYGHATATSPLLGHAAHRPGLPALLEPQAARPGRRAPRPGEPADRNRPRRPHRQRQRRHPHHLRSDPRRARSRSSS